MKKDERVVTDHRDAEKHNLQEMTKDAPSTDPKQMDRYEDEDTIDNDKILHDNLKLKAENKIRTQGLAYKDTNDGDLREDNVKDEAYHEDGKKDYTEPNQTGDAIPSRNDVVGEEPTLRTAAGRPIYSD